MSFKKQIQSKYEVVCLVPSGSEKPVEVSCTYDEISKYAHKTHAPDNFYIDYSKLPSCIKSLFNKAHPELDESSYTVHTPTAFLRISVITKDNAEIDMEVHLGQLPEPEDNDDDEMDRDEYLLDLASEMKATFDWKNQDVYFEVNQYPDEVVAKYIHANKDPIYLQEGYVQRMIKGTFPELIFNKNLSRHNLVFDVKDKDFKIEIGVLYSKDSEFLYRSFKIKDGRILKSGKEVNTLKDLSKEIEKLLI